MSDRDKVTDSAAEQSAKFSLRDALMEDVEKDGEAPPHLVVIRALMDDILPLIEEGWTLARIYRVLKNAKKVTCSDQTFRRLFNGEKERREHEASGSRPAISSPSAGAGRPDPQAPTRLTPARPPNKL